MVVVVLERFANKFYGTNSKFELSNLSELQDVTCHISTDTIANVMHKELMRVLQDDELVALLLDRKNELHGDYALLHENDVHYTLVWCIEFNLNFNHEKIDALTIPKFEVCLLEFFIR
jgi:hypothetical protein